MRRGYIKAENGDGFNIYINVDGLVDVILLARGGMSLDGKSEPVLYLTLVAGQEIQLKGDVREKFLACDPFSQSPREKA